MSNLDLYHIEYVLKEQIDHIYNHFEGDTSHYIGVPLRHEGKYISLVVELGKRDINAIGIMVSNPNSFYEIKPFYQSDENLCYYDKDYAPDNEFTMEDRVNENNIEDFFMEYGSFVHELGFEEPHTDIVYKEAHINYPDVCLNQMMRILKEHVLELESYIDDFKQQSIICHIY